MNLALVHARAILINAVCNYHGLYQPINYRLESIGWTEIYSQNAPSNSFSSCDESGCNIDDGETFMNFVVIENLAEYHFKIVWNNGTVLSDFNDNPNKQDYGIEWKQSVNPLHRYDTDMNPTEVKLIPSGNVPEIFNFEPSQVFTLVPITRFIPENRIFHIQV